MIDPVSQCLNRYLAEQDRQEAQAEAEEELVKEWMGEHKAVKEAIGDLMCMEKLELDFDIADILTSTGDDRKVKIERFFDKIEQAVKAEFESVAADALEQKRQQSLMDKAEQDAMDREDGEC